MPSGAGHRLTIATGPIVLSMDLPRPCRPTRPAKAFLAKAARRYRGFITGAPALVSMELEPLLSRRLAGWPEESKPGAAGCGENADPLITGSLPKAGISARRGRFLCSAPRFGWELSDSRGKGVFRPGPYDLDSLLRTLVSHLAPDAGGVLLHCASLSFRGRSHLFVGPSGAGKTTLSRKLGGRRLEPGHSVKVLSDELTLLTGTGAGSRPAFLAHSTPFWGEFRLPENNGSAPLGRVFLLRKGPAAVRPMKTGPAVAELLRCLVCFERSGPVLGRSLDLLLAVLAKHPAAELYWDGKRTDHIVAMLRQERRTS
ncbi:MAG: hypothetical protein WC943_10995 [Elusimicrobiota bacterium]|jgi:hypothetical protein